MVWHQQLSDLANLWEKKKQSVSIAATKEVQKERRRESEAERVAALNWDKDKTNSVNSSPLGFLALHSVPVLPLQMLPGIKQEVYHG